MAEESESGTELESISSSRGDTTTDTSSSCYDSRMLPMDSTVAPSTSKRRKHGSGMGRFKLGWNLPPYITSSRKGYKFSLCKLCSSDFSITHGGFNDIKRHVEGLNHQRRLKQSKQSSNIVTFFGEPSMAHASKVMVAELMMAHFIAQHNLPFQAADHLSDLMSSMFPDSKIAADFSCKHTKTKSVICDALDPYMKKPVINIVRTAPFNLLCDESNERGDSVKLLTILVRIYEPRDAIIVTRHLDTVGIQDFTADGIFVAIEETLKKYSIPFCNLMSFTSDTCNVMKGFRKGVIAKLRALQPKVIDIHCICHLVNLCVKTAIKALPIKVDDLLVDIYYHFRNSVKRVSSLQDYANFCSVEYKAVLSHCETRWLSLRRAIIQTLQMWDPLYSYFHSHSDVEKPGKVRTVSMVLGDQLTKL